MQTQALTHIPDKSACTHSCITIKKKVSGLIYQDFYAGCDPYDHHYKASKLHTLIKLVETPTLLEALDSNYG